MGVVFRARQLTLNRVVAFKMILAGQFASDEDVRRFKTEAEAAARLQHPGIVPIYEIGEHEGKHFFSMGFIDGDSLAEQAKAGPLPPRRAATYIRKIADAVAYAHQQGVIHRDLKPPNILVDENDEPKVTDFGLAKQVEAESHLTATGQILGTPAYMPPEQAAGEIYDVGPAADIYSLGAILYELLTGRPPFQSAKVMDILKQVINQDPVAPRQLNPGISRDLETICLKCLEKQPVSRYESAREFANELGRFLNGEPIKARPVGWASRSWRWCRRNPKVATLGLSTLLCLLLALVATSIGYITTTAAQRRAERGEQQATAAQLRAEEGFAEARRAVNEFFTLVSEETLLNQPGMQPLKETLLRRALDYYRSFLDARGTDETIRDELASTYFRVGRITEEIGSPEDALDYYQRAEQLQAQLLARNPKDVELQDARSTTVNARARLLSRLQKFDMALDAYQQARRLRADLAQRGARRTFRFWSGGFCVGTCARGAAGTADPE